MHRISTPIAGLLLLEIDAKQDDRGLFARTWDRMEAAQWGAQETFDYSCISVNRSLHTLRGMHYQKPPYGEVKLVRCTRGSIFDVAVDLRPGSPTLRHWYGVELNEENRRSLYIPPGFAHGFLTLKPNTEVLYAITHPFVPEAASGVRWNDPAFHIEWPAPPQVISPRDATYPDFV